MIRLPEKRQRERFGTERAPKREWPRHRKFVRGHECIIKGKHECSGGIVFAHIRSAANAGKGQKPFDWFGVSMCSDAHLEQHTIGQPAFERKYNVDLFALAAEFARRSTDQAMKEAMKAMEQANG